MKKCECSKTIIKKLKSISGKELEIVVCVKCKRYILKREV